MKNRRLLVACLGLLLGCACEGSRSCCTSEPSSPAGSPTAQPSAGQTRPAVPSSEPPAAEQAPPPAREGPADPHAYADLDPTNDLEVGPPPPLPDCEERLQAAGIEFTAASLPIRTSRRGERICGAEQVVIYRKGPRGVRYNAPPLLTCSMALALARFEQIAVEEAERLLGAGVTRIRHGGTYSCRNMSRFRLVSEHSYANAIDVYELVLSNGKKISIKRDFCPIDGSAVGPTGEYLRTLARRCYDENVFSVVLTSYFDRLHSDHLHMDLARYRVDGTR